MANILFLYSEMMPYMEAVINSLVVDYGNEVCVVSWDKKRLTPHVPQYPNSVKSFNRSEFDVAKLKELMKRFNPGLIYVSGRMDKGYLKALKNIDPGTFVIMGMDSQWFGTVKQYIQVLFSPFLYKKYFTHIWVPGSRQYTFARLLGYAPTEIIRGLYTGNYHLFSQNNFLLRKEKRIVFLGRLEKIKGLDLLLEAWLDLNQEFKGEWKLTIIGQGSLSKLAEKVEGVELTGFLEQKEILNLLENDCVFCLPSRKEPWGVVVHEMAAAGLPLILSKQVGAGEKFLIHGYNGFLLDTLSVVSIKNSLEKMMQLTESERKNFGVRSMELSKELTPELAAASLNSVLT